MVEDSGNMNSGSEPVQISDWVQANRPKLHPTRRKVLAGVARFSQNGAWTTSSEVRKDVGISQQLLNRHIRALEEDGLVVLENQGPGLPLRAQATNAGLRALGFRGPRPAQPGQDEQPRAEVPSGTQPPAGDAAAAPPAPPAAPAQPAAAATPAAAPKPAQHKPVLQLSRKAYDFLERLYNALSPFLKSLDRRDFYLLTAPALHKRPVVGALFEALDQYLPGLRAVEFREIVASLTGAQIAPKDKTESRPWPGQRQDFAGAQGPPELSQAEKALEQQLASSMNPAYKGMAWHQRTRLMGDEWDRALRRRMGLFRTRFTDFGPRWERADWNDFNQARRQADHRGGDYAEWVAVQFDRLAPEGQREVMPGELHGERAMAAYLEYRQEMDGEKKRELGKPPYTAHSFSTQDPSHVDYAQRLIAETTALADHIMGGDPHGPARLLAQAVRSEALPMPALDLAPLYRQEVLSILRGDASQYRPIQPAAAPLPKVII